MLVWPGGSDSHVCLDVNSLSLCGSLPCGQELWQWSEGTLWVLSGPVISRSMLAGDWAELRP